MPKLVDVTQKYGNKPVFEGFCAEFPDKKISAILGKSGVGKTTLLNVIAGVTEYRGSAEGFGVPSYVFQSACLIPHLSVYENLEYVLYSVEKDKEKRKAEIDGVLSAVGLADLKNRRADNLSGGEAQRVALSRAFVFPCDTVLLDEAFNSLDLSLKIGLMKDLRALSESFGKTCVFVTHNVDEALFVSDEVFVLKKNRLIDLGSVEDERSYGYESDDTLRKKLYEYLLNEV